MKINQFQKKQWTNIMFDEDMKIIEVENPNSLLFFGKSLIVGQKVIDLFPCELQIQPIIEGLRCAKEEDRLVYLEYLSMNAGEAIPVIAFAEYGEEDTYCLSVMAVHTSDLCRARGDADLYNQVAKDVADRVQLQKKYETLYNQMMTVVNSLPVGVELYGEDGQLLYLNDTDYQIFGVDRETFDISNVNIQDNPNLPLEVKEGVKNGINTCTAFPYSFGVVRDTEFYMTSQAGVIQIECNGRPVVNASGKVESYVFIVRDVTEDTRRNEELRQSKKKSELAMQAADIVLWEFDVARQLFFSDNEPLNGYNNSKPITVEEYRNCIHSDDLPQIVEILERICVGSDYSFNIDIRVKLPNYNDWQYCTINGSPYEKSNDGKVTKFIGTRRNNTELHRKKQLQENILNSIPVSIHIKDIADNFRYVFCNDESKRLFGIYEDTIAGDVVDVDKVARIEKTDLDVFDTGKPYSGLEHIALKDGRVYDVIVRKNIIYDGDKRLLLTVRWDQSLQNELERRAKILNITMEFMKAYIWFYEPDKDLITFGEGADKIGRQAIQFDSFKTFQSFVHPEDKQIFEDSFNKALSHDTGEWSVEYRADLYADGCYEWFQTRGLVETVLRDDLPYTYMFGMTINIEEHKQAELTLLRNKEELNRLIRQNEMVLNNMNSGLAYISSEHIVQWENIGICLDASNGAYSKGKLCYESTHGRTSPCQNCVMERAFSSGQVERKKQMFGDRMVEVFASPVFKEDGSPEGIVIRVDDITDREKMIEDLKHAIESDKLKSAFLANMSHEIRTPLNAIIGFSEILMTTTDEEEKQEFIRIINNNNELLLKLINDILDLSKIEAGAIELKYEDFDLASYFEGMGISMKHRVTNSDVQLIVTNPYPACIVKLDKNRVAQILTNYITNAIKYTKEGTIEIGYEQVDQGVRFYVKDTGIGIPDEKKLKVFMRFEKLDEFAQGTGLGLSICKAIAETMGGKVGFESKYGEGSLFWAWLPCEIKIIPV